MRVKHMSGYTSRRLQQVHPYFRGEAAPAHVVESQSGSATHRREWVEHAREMLRAARVSRPKRGTIPEKRRVRRRLAEDLVAIRRQCARRRRRHWSWRIRPWGHLGVTSGSLWGHFGVTLGSLWNTSGSFWNHFGFTMGVTLVSLWGHFEGYVGGKCVVTLSGHFWVTLGAL